MGFLASLLPIAISLVFSARTTHLTFNPTSVVSFFGLFWLPYHNDLPYQIIFNALSVSFINAILSLLAPRFPRLLSAYSTGASPRIQFNGQNLLPENNWLAAAFLVVCLGGWLANSMRMSLSYKFMSALALQSMLMVLGFYALLHVATVLWIYIRHYSEKPLLGLATGMLWPPLHPLRRFLLRIRNKLGRSLGPRTSPAVRPGSAEGQLGAGRTDPA